MIYAVPLKNWKIKFLIAAALEILDGLVTLLSFGLLRSMFFTRYALKPERKRPETGVDK